mmetsp:Transcript_148137/g.258927  ORF Transcript_148137/g.258927 Transcript_148137/m.258927 type:complete len:88 (+) Transcript_148137:136-399(+)
MYITYPLIQLHEGTESPQRIKFAYSLHKILLSFLDEPGLVASPLKGLLDRLSHTYLVFTIPSAPLQKDLALEQDRGASGFCTGVKKT